MGDLIVYSSVFNALKFFYPSANLYLLTSNEFKDLFESHSCLKKVITIDRKKHSARKIAQRTLKEIEKIDLLIDLHGSLRSFLVRMFLPAIPRLIVNKRRLKRWIYLLFRVNLLKNEKNPIPHRILFDLLPQLGIQMDETILKKISQRLDAGQSGQLTSLGLAANACPQKFLIPMPYLILMPSAAHSQKRWPVNYFKELIELVLADDKLSHYHLLVMGGKDDSFCQQLDFKESRFFNLQGQTTLAESFNLISKATMIIGNDTGLLHGAEALGVRALMIYGPTSEYFGFSPHLKNSQFISQSLWCKPCSLTGSRACFRSEPFCLTLIKPQIVLAKIKEMLNV